MFYDYFPYVDDDIIDYLRFEVVNAIEELSSITELHGSDILYEEYELLEPKTIGFRKEVTVKNGGFAGHVRFLEKAECGRKRRTTKKPKRTKAPHKR